VDGVDISAFDEEQLGRCAARSGCSSRGRPLRFDDGLRERGLRLREHKPDLSEEKVAERVYEVLGYVNLGRDVARLLPSSLSGGMKKRVSLARTVS